MFLSTAAIVATTASSQSTFAALPIFGSPVGVTSNEISVGRFVYGTLPINDRGVTAAATTSAIYRWRADGLSPTQLDPGPRASTIAPAVGVSAAGTVAGTIRKTVDGINKGDRAVRWSIDAALPIEMQTLGSAADGVSSTAHTGISSTGISIGTGNKYVDGVSVGARPIRWSASGVATELGAIPTASGGFGSATPAEVNAAGTAVGWSLRYPASGGGRRSPVRWNHDTSSVTALDTLGVAADGVPTGEAVSINTAGTSVGNSSRYTSGTFAGTFAVRWDANTTAATVLPHLGDVPSANQSRSEAFDINDRGDIAGSVAQLTATGRVTYRGVKWIAGQTEPLVLDDLRRNADGVTQTEAYAINELGAAVGTTDDYESSTRVGPRAMLWASGSAGTDLNTLIEPGSGWTLEEAGGISDTGFIRGIGKFDPDGTGGVAAYSRSWTMLVPEAGTYGRGDANFDTQTNFADLVLLAQNYNAANASKRVNVGDFNLDGVTNFADLVTLAQHYNTGLANVAALGNATLAADWALAQSMVPEPSVIMAIAAAMLPLSRRRVGCASHTGR